MSDLHLDAISNASPASEAANHLSRFTFSNPQDFLKILQKDADKISVTDTISTHDLAIYAQTGQDADGRAAAAIALSHFDNFKALGPNQFNDGVDAKIDHHLEIPKDDLNTDLAFSQGHTAARIAETEIIDGLLLGLSTVGATLVGVVALAESGIPVVGVPLAIATGAGAAAIVGYPVYKMATDPFVINKAAKNDQQTLASWPEINSDKPGTGLKH